MATFSFRQLLQTLNIMHWTITITPVIFGGVVLFVLNEPTNPWEFETDNPMFYLPWIYFIVAIPLSKFMFNTVLKSNAPSKSMSLKSRLGAYQTAHLVRLAVLETAAIMAVVISLVTETLISFPVLLLALIMMFSQFPSKGKIVETLELSEAEIAELDA